LSMLISIRPTSTFFVWCAPRWFSFPSLGSCSRHFSAWRRARSKIVWPSAAKGGAPSLRYSTFSCCQSWPACWRSVFFLTIALWNISCAIPHSLFFRNSQGVFDPSLQHLFSPPKDFDSPLPHFCAWPTNILTLGFYSILQTPPPVAFPSGSLVPNP